MCILQHATDCMKICPCIQNNCSGSKMIHRMIWIGWKQEVNTDREDEVSEMFRLSLLFFWRIRWSISSHAKMTDVGEKKIEPVRNCCNSSQLLARFMRVPYVLRNGDVLHVYLPWALRKHSDAHCTSAGILVGRTVENAPVQWPIAARVVTKK